jgi:hypothetical protein
MIRFFKKKKKTIFYLFIFFSQTFKEKNVKRKIHMGWSTTHKMPWGGLGPSGVAGHPFDFSIFDFDFFIFYTHHYSYRWLPRHP